MISFHKSALQVALFNSISFQVNSFNFMPLQVGGFPDTLFGISAVPGFVQ